MEDKPAQREHRTHGVTKQHDYRRSEPISPAGNHNGAPKGNAATLRRRFDRPRLYAVQGRKARKKVRGVLSSIPMEERAGVRRRPSDHELDSPPLHSCVPERRRVYSQTFSNMGKLSSLYDAAGF